MPDRPNHSGYAEDAAAQDAMLDERLAAIRRQQDQGTITIRQAADLRVAALEHHLEAVRALRAEYFGEDR
ncbi:MAG TPA: hypothetical protein VLM11_01625 [Streptosporangiaceae bacterium]|nr:hypothetical protein [Streptosporangiaceae bacterium]